MELSKLKNMVKPLTDELNKSGVNLVCITYKKDSGDILVFGYNKKTERVALPDNMEASVYKAKDSLYFKILLKHITDKCKKMYPDFVIQAVRFNYMVDDNVLNIYCCNKENGINDSRIINF